MQQTVIGIKPDAFFPNAKRESGSELKVPLPENPQDFIDEVKILVTEKSLRILNEHTKICTEEVARKHYAEFADFFDENFQENKQDFLASYLTSGKSHWILCEGEDAINKGREVIKYIREKYLMTPKKARYNMTHGSGNLEEALYEKELHFGE